MYRVIVSLLLLAAAASADARTALLKRPGGGSAAAVGFRAALSTTELPRWPIEMRSVDELRKLCLPATCERWDRLELALQRAAQWMASYSEGKPRFDAAVALSQIRQTVDSDALRAAFEAARAIADRDQDHPHRRFWQPDLQAPASATSRWPVPTAPGKRIGSNYVLSEALFCRESGWRPETMVYVCGIMRDQGGYESTHALWGLAIAHQNGCIKDEDYAPCALSLQEELAKAQPLDFRPQATLDIDLYAERVLQSLLTGTTNPAVDTWAETLLRLQNDDGSWGMRRDGEEPYYRYHATMMSTWAAAEWYRRFVAYPQLRPR